MQKAAAEGMERLLAWDAVRVTMVVSQPLFFPFECGKVSWSWQVF
jgi:hypothetical protein